MQRAIDQVDGVVWNPNHWLSSDFELPWREIVERSGEEAPHQALFSALRSRWSPRILAVAAEYLADRLENIDGDFFVYGAGSHTRELFKHPQLAPYRSRCAGCLDVRAATCDSQDALGWPVFHPDRLDDLPPIPIVLSHHEFESSLEAVLIARNVAPARVVRLYTAPEYRKRIEPHSRAYLDAIRPANGNDRIAIITARPTSIVPSCMWEWVAEQTTSLIQFDMTRNGARLSAQIDYQNCKQSLSWLIAGIAKYRPKMIYVYDQFTTGNVIGLLAKMVFSECKVVLEAYDVLRLHFESPKQLTRDWYWGASDFELASYVDPGGTFRFDGLVTKEAPAAVCGLISDNNTPILHFKPYVCEREMMRVRTAHRPKAPRIVWAGSLVPSRESAALFRDGQILPTLRCLAEQGLDLTLITGDTEPNFRAVYPDYAQWVDRQEHVAFVSGMPRTLLIRHLSSHYDFGLLLNYVDPGSECRAGMRSTFASKFITYVAAGLPIIVSRELAHMAALVEEWEIGIVVAQAELKDVASIVRSVVNSASFRRFERKLARAQSHFSAENHFDRFLAFLAEVKRAPADAYT